MIDEPSAAAADDPAHAAAVERWRRSRVERLIAPGGWLTLVDRIVLDEGDNETPIGLVRVSQGRVWLRARSNVPVIDGRERELHTEETGTLERIPAGGRVYELSRNAGQFSLRVKDPESAARRNFRGLTFFAIDPGWRLRARLEVPGTSIGGVAHFSVDGRPYSLSTEDTGGSRLVFVFGDETNRTDTYPGGRFLYADPPVGGELVLDFNFAFNPPCAFTPHAICPAVLPRNRLPLAVTAGERRYEET
jgi:uncharacterized protein (DUF1684 family)